MTLLTKLLHDNILVEKIEEKKGIIVTTDEDKRGEIDKGKVLAVGKGYSYGLPEFKYMEVRVGDIIFYLKNQAVKIEVESKKYIIARERDVIAVL